MMIKYSIENLRNVGFIGHGSVGKTSLVEALLFCTGNTDRLGKVEDGTTVMDFDNEEKKRGMSISVSVASLESQDTKLNLIDVPGYFDFEGELRQGMRAADVAIITVCGVAGIQVGTEKAWDYCNKIKLPRTFFINKLDRENSSFDKVLEKLKDEFGIGAVPIQYPIGCEGEFKGVINVISKQARVINKKTNKMEKVEIPEELIEKIDKCKEMIMEAVAEGDEVLLDKYFATGELSTEEIYNGLIKGCASGDIAPVMCGSATKLIGVDCLIEDIIECFPSPIHSVSQKCSNIVTKNEEYKNFNENEDFSAFVFKTLADPFVGKISLLKVITGKLKNDMLVSNSKKGEVEKLSHVFFLKGKNQISTTEVIAGDIVAVAKLQYTETGDTLCSSNLKIAYDDINLPEATLAMSIMPKDKKDEDKISIALQKLKEEDPTIKIDRDVENVETIVSGLGETHIDVIASKLKNKYSVGVILQLPKIPYRETIKGISDVQGKHKKQSGGHGQYGDVKIKFEPGKSGNHNLEFVDNVVGGAVPRNFIPAVEKGLRDCMAHGVLAGYPVIGVRATLHDGSYHAVDSSEMAFKMAASIAYKKGLEAAKPILLEPILKVDILVPDEYMGDIMGDINKKRGKILGMEKEGKYQRVTAEVPMAEMIGYSTVLRSMTQARGSFTTEISRYDEVPASELEKIIKSKKEN